MKIRLLKKLRKKACKKYKIYKVKNKYFIITDSFWNISPEFNDYIQAKNVCLSYRRDYILNLLFSDYKYKYIDKHKKLVF